MPKIGNHDVNIEGNISRYELHYKKGLGFYLIGLPKDLFSLVSDSDGIDRPNGYFKTEDELVVEVRKFLRRYHEIKRQFRKVIIYSISASAELRMNKVSNSHFEGLKSWVSKKVDHMGFESPDFSLGFSWICAEEIDNTNTRKYFIEKTDGSTVVTREYRLKNSDTVIDYSHEIEALFVSVEKGMENLLKILCNNLLSGEDHLKLISKNTSNLIGNNEH